MALIDVRFGTLAKPPCVDSIEEGMTLGQFCIRNGKSYSSAIRVNGKVENENYVLRVNDLVTHIPSVEGGL